MIVGFLLVVVALAFIGAGVWQCAEYLGVLASSKKSQGDDEAVL